MKEIILDAFYNEDKHLNKFMHCADVFESFKQLASYHQVKLGVSFRDDEVGRAQNTVNILKSAIESAGGNVVFISVRTIDNIPMQMNNYLMEGVSMISFGTKFGMFHEMLEKLGYEVKTNKYMQVVSAKFKIK